MAQSSSPNLNSLPGIVTDQPEIFESEPALSDDTGVNDLDLIADQSDEAVALIEVPIKQAFSYFAERESEIAKFYVQRHGEYKISGGKPEEETDVEKYHRLVSEVNQLLNKFQTDQAAQVTKDGMSIASSALTNNLEILSRQLKALEFAAEDGSLNPTLSGFIRIKSKLDELREKVSTNDVVASTTTQTSASSDTAKLIHMSALERRLNILETYLGNNDDKIQTVLKTTKCDNLTDAVNTVGPWLALFKSDTLQRVNNEIDFVTQRLEKLKGQVSNDEELKLDPQARSRLDRLYDLVTATDKHRALVPTVIHRLNAMEELQQKTAQVTTTVHHLEQTQAQIVDRLQSSKSELTSLTEMFAKNIELIKEFSKDIDSRIAAIREEDQ